MAEHSEDEAVGAGAGGGGASTTSTMRLPQGSGFTLAINLAQDVDLYAAAQGTISTMDTAYSMAGVGEGDSTANRDSSERLEEVAKTISNGQRYAVVQKKNKPKPRLSGYEWDMN